MVEKTTKTVKVPRSKAEEWESHVEENPEVETVSHLIRLSVEREMNGKYSSEPQRSTDDEGASAASGEMLTALRRIEAAVKDVDERLTAIEELQGAEAGYSLKKAVFSLLPSDDELKSPIGTVDEIPEAENPEELGVLTVEELSRKLGADPNDVERVLDELVEETGRVLRSDVNHDGRHYWKKGQ